MTRPPTPQLEDGYTRVANELYEAILSFGFSQRQLLVLFAIVRKTYGFQKKEDDMSASQIASMCNLARSHVTTTLNGLAALNVISKRPGVFGSIIGVQKNHCEWVKKALRIDRKNGAKSVQGCTESVRVPKQYAAGTESVQVDSTGLVHTKENLPKENQQKKVSRPELCFTDWTDQLKAEGKKAIPEDHEVFDYAERINLPIDFVRLCWLEFRRDHMDRPKKKQANWPKTFSNYVRKNYYRLWFEKDHGWQLTTAGIQLQKEMKDVR